MVGKVKRLWEAGTWRPPAEGGGESAPLSEAVVELEGAGHVFLALDADGESPFEVLTEVEAVFHRQMVALFAHTLRESVPLARALGLQLPRAQLLFVAAMRDQLRAIGAP